MTVVTWPTIADYSTAVQTPERALGVADLQGVVFETRPPLHLPVAASGANAVVFRADLSGRTIAVRCFTSEPGDERGRYLAFHDHAAQKALSSISPPTWYDHAIWVRDEWRPVVVMDWLTGLPLHRFVEERLHRPMELLDLAQRWHTLMTELTGAQIAHGDLQHGNVLVSAQNDLRLIDFDGIWIPQISHLPPNEWGHPNYQHPERGELGTWGPHIDWFSALVIDVSIRALAADPDLWSFHNEENLIFTEDDFRGSSPLWDHLSASNDPLVRQRSSLLADCCGASAALSVNFATLVEHGLPSSGASSASAHANGAASSTQAGGATTSTAGTFSTGGQSAGSASTGPPHQESTPWWITGASGTAASGAGSTDTYSSSGSGASAGPVPNPGAASAGNWWDTRAGTTSPPPPGPRTSPPPPPGPRTSPPPPGPGTSTAPPSGPSTARTRPPERRKATKQQANASWDTKSPGRRQTAAGSPTMPMPPGGIRQPPAPGATSSVPGAAPPASTGGGRSFVWTLVLAAALAGCAAAFIEDPDVRSRVLGVIAVVVVIDLIRSLIAQGRKTGP